MEAQDLEPGGTYSPILLMRSLRFREAKGRPMVNQQAVNKAETRTLILRPKCYMLN